MYYLLAEIEVLLSKTEQFGSVEKAPAFCVAVFRQSFMQRVHAENTCISQCLGSRAKPILLGLCASSRDLPVLHNRLADTVMQKKGRIFNDVLLTVKNVQKLRRL